ncbi:hypothetical protein NEOKW01_0537 [Nematocida sp. AWRm80]|nr:hypothetical protein NEOKW01_0537 [Nematocida sp. AWRm80]
MSLNSVLKHIVANYKEKKNSKIQNIIRDIGISRKELIHILEMLKEQLRKIGYRLVPGVEKRTNVHTGELLLSSSVSVEYTHLTDSFEKCSFVYLIREEPYDKEEIPNRSMGDIRYIVPVIYLLIMFNNSEIEYSALVQQLEKAQINEIDLKQAIEQNYIKKQKKGERYWVRPDWKFFVEYPNFSVSHYLRELKLSNVNF